jgi:hypothetical protein
MIGNPTTAAVTDSTLNEAINDAVVEISDEFNFQKVKRIGTFSTVIGTDKYQLITSNVVAILHLWDETNKRRIRKRAVNTFAEIGGQPTRRGKPLWYIRQEDYTILVPVPDGVYSISYFAKTTAAALVNDTDEPSLPPAWHIGAVRLARHIYWDSVGDVPRAQYAFNNYRLWIQRKPSEEAEESLDEETGVELPTLNQIIRGDISTAQEIWAEEDSR